MAPTFLIWQVAATIEEEVAMYGKEGQVDSDEDDDEKEEVPARCAEIWPEKFAEIRARRKGRDLPEISSARSREISGQISAEISAYLGGWPAQDFMKIALAAEDELLIAQAC